MSWIYIEIDLTALQWIDAKHPHLIMRPNVYDTEDYPTIMGILVRQFGGCLESWNGDMILDIDPIQKSLGRFVPSRAQHHPPLFQCHSPRPMELLFPTKEQALLAKLILT